MAQQLGGQAAQDGQRRLVLVVGAGVIGVTAAHALLDRGYAVTIVARESAHSLTSTRFASPWAGAVWCPFSDDVQPRQSDWERTTFAKWCETKGIRRGPSGENQKQAPSKDAIPIPDTVLALVPFRRIDKAADGISDNVDARPWWHDVVLNYEKSDGATQCSTFTIDAPAYLFEMLKALDTNPHFTLIKAEVTSLVGACAFLGTATACVINATGLGARTLTDVQDADVEPIGGQLVRLQAISDHVDPTVLFVEDDDASQDKGSAQDKPSTAADESGASETIERLYMIPRALSGDVVLGGTDQYGSYDVTPSPHQTKRIITRMLEHCPWLHVDMSEQEGGAMTDVTAESRATTANEPNQHASADAYRNDTGRPSNNVYRVASVSVGLRPGRKSGPRLELDARGITTSLIAEYESSLDSEYGKQGRQEDPGPAKAKTVRTKSMAAKDHTANDKVPIVHAYGFGKTGFQVSWGVAHEIADLVDSQLGRADKQ